MKKTILFFALILGMSGFVAAQSCSSGYGYNGSNNGYYYAPTSNFNSLGVIRTQWRGSFDRNYVVDARIFHKRGNKMTIEYIFDNGDVLEVQTKKIRGQGNHHGNRPGANHNRPNGYHNRPNANRVGNDYYYQSSNSYTNRGFERGKFEIHCATLNGQPLPVKCGTLTVRQGARRGAQTTLDMEVGRRGKFTGNVKVFKTR